MSKNKKYKYFLITTLGVLSYYPQGDNQEQIKLSRTNKSCSQRYITLFSCYKEDKDLQIIIPLTIDLNIHATSPSPNLFGWNRQNLITSTFLFNRDYYRFCQRQVLCNVKSLKSPLFHHFMKNVFVRRIQVRIILLST